MIALLKGLIPGIILSLVVSLFIGSSGSQGGFLYVHQVTLLDYDFYWSWMLFIMGAGLATVLFLMMD